MLPENMNEYRRIASRDHTLAGPLWEGGRESRTYSRDTYPESYITKYAVAPRARSVSSSLLGPVDPSSRVLCGRLKFTVRRHKFNQGRSSDADDLVSFNGYQSPSEVQRSGDVSLIRRIKAPKILFLRRRTCRQRWRCAGTS